MGAPRYGRRAASTPPLYHRAGLYVETTMISSAGFFATYFLGHYALRAIYTCRAMTFRERESRRPSCSLFDFILHDFLTKMPAAARKPPPASRPRDALVITAGHAFMT